MTEQDNSADTAFAAAWAAAQERAEAAEAEADTALARAEAALSGGDEAQAEAEVEVAVEALVEAEVAEEAAEAIEVEAAVEAAEEAVVEEADALVEAAEEAEALAEAEAEVLAEEAVEAAIEEAAEEAAAEEEPDPEAEFRAAMAAALGDWYVVHSYAGFENRVKANLESRITTMNMEDSIFQVEVPIEEVTEIKGGVRKQVKRNKFPGYVLVRMDMTDESWGVVRHTPGVTGFVGHGHTPNPLTLDEAVAILAPKPEKKAGAAATAAAPRVVDFEVGDAVTIIEGAFGTMQASISEINPESQKVIVMVELFGRETPVELTFAQIEKG